MKKPQPADDPGRMAPEGAFDNNSKSLSMSNLQNSFEQQVQTFTTGLVAAVTALAPLFLILIIFGIAGANAYVEYLYQLGIFGGYAIGPAVLVAGLRFSSGMGGISLMKSGAYIPGAFFVVVSLALTFYTWWHVDAIAGLIAPAQPVAAAFTVSMILWGGFIGELMIAAYMGGVGNFTQRAAVEEEKEEGEEDHGHFSEPKAHPSANGNGKAKKAEFHPNGKAHH